MLMGWKDLQRFWPIYILRCTYSTIILVSFLVLLMGPLGQCSSGPNPNYNPFWIPCSSPLVGITLRSISLSSKIRVLILMPMKIHGVILMRFKMAHLFRTHMGNWNTDLDPGWDACDRCVTTFVIILGNNRGPITT